MDWMADDRKVVTWYDASMIEVRNMMRSRYAGLYLSSSLSDFASPTLEDDSHIW